MTLKKNSNIMMEIKIQKYNIDIKLIVKFLFFINAINALNAQEEQKLADQQMK